MAKPDDVGVGVCVIIVDAQRRGLMLKRSPAATHGPGVWSFPGGWHERADDTFVDTARHEARDEVGVTIKNAEFVHVTTQDHPEAGFRSVTVYLVARAGGWAGTPVNKEPGKVTEIGWFPLAGLPDPLWHSGVREAAWKALVKLGGNVRSV